jgi:hypothetical protein
MRHAHDTLNAAAIDKLRVAADGLESFKWYRGRADYDLHLSCTKDHALISAAKTEQIMTEVRGALL